MKTQNNNFAKKAKLTCLSLATLLAISVISPEAEARRGRGAPQVALTACESKASGDACQFENRKGDELTGTCEESRRSSETLVCKPENHEALREERRSRRSRR